MTEPRSGRDRPRDDTTQLLQWLVFLRVVVSTFILFTTFLVPLPAPLAYLSVLVVANVLANLLAAFFLGRAPALSGLTSFLIYWDVLFVTLLVYVSGGSQSPFSFMYILSLIYAGLLLHTRGAITASVLCLVAFGSILLAQHAGGLLLPGGERLALPAVGAREVFFKVLINGIAFFIAAFLSNLIAEQLRKTGAQLAEREVDLGALRKLHENIVRSVEIGLITTDREARVTFVNPTGVRILGLPPSRLVGRSLRELFPPIRPALDQGERTPRGPDPAKQRWEGPWAREGAEPLHLGFSISRLHDAAEERIGWIVSFQDLTEFRRMEQEMKRADRLASVGKLAAGIAHEVRNPLASISGAIQVLSAELRLDAVNRSLMEIVLRETDRLNRLITDFLDFARPGRVQAEMIDLNLLLDETVQIARHAAGEGVPIFFRRDFEPGVFLRADSGQLRQLFLNLLLNAVQAMERGGRISVATRRIPPSEEWPGDGAVRVEVEDTGAGIPAEVMEAIFDPFFTTKEAGTGLGLTVAYRIVENHGGKIFVDSEPGRGTKFTVLMPAAGRAAAEEEREVPRAEAAG